MKLVNLTPHPIVLAKGDQREVVPSAGVARVATTSGSEIARVRVRDSVPAGAAHDAAYHLPQTMREAMDIPVYSPPTYGSVEGLPDPEPGLVYIVSAMVGAALREAGVSRPDVLCPGTGPQDGAIRDPEGRIQAVTRLIRATLL